MELVTPQLNAHLKEALLVAIVLLGKNILLFRLKNIIYIDILRHTLDLF